MFGSVKSKHKNETSHLEGCLYRMAQRSRSYSHVTRAVPRVCVYMYAQGLSNHPIPSSIVFVNVLCEYYILWEIFRTVLDILYANFYRHAVTSCSFTTSHQVSEFLTK
jgi:hypothetical protein